MHTLVLLLAIFPLIGPEITSDPLPPKNQVLSLAAPAAAMARDDRGVVIAWTAHAGPGNGIFVARLDPAGHVAGAVQTLPTRGDAYAPSIAKSADGFLVAWVELYGSGVFAGAKYIYCRLDSHLMAGRPETFSTSVQGAATDPPVARSSAGDWVTATGYVLQLGPNGPPAPVGSGVVASDMAATPSFPIIVGAQQTRIVANCTCSEDHEWTCPDRCATYRYLITVRIIWLYSADVSRSTVIDANGRPAVATDGRDALVAWFEGDARVGGIVGASRLVPGDARKPNPFQHDIVLGVFGGEGNLTRPDIATDGNRYVVVWRTQNPSGDNDIIGAAIDNDNRVTPLSIAMSASDERDPSVISVGAGRFLVAYEKVDGSERRLAGRFIDFGERKRAAHSVN